MLGRLEMMVRRHWTSKVHFITVLILGAFSQPLVYSNESSCCVDEDIAAAFLPHAVYSREWLDHFPIHLSDDDLTYLGSSWHPQGRYGSVAWSTGSAPNEALSIATTSIIQSDWLPIPGNDQMSAYFDRGFVAQSAIPIPNNQRYCKGREGILSVQVRDTEVGTILVMSHHYMQPGQRCEDQLSPNQSLHILGRGLTQYLPRLALPESIVLPGMPGSGISGGGRDAHASLRLETDMSSSELVSVFESQMSDQGWAQDASFQGAKSGGHTWRKDVEDMTLICIVTVFSNEESVHLRMHLEPL